MILSHAQKFVFLKPMKVAGSSLELSLYPFLQRGDLALPMSVGRDVLVSKDVIGPGQEPSVMRLRKQLRHHEPLASALRILRRPLSGYRVFTVERNPWDRAVSMFFWQRKAQEPLSFDSARTAFGSWVRSGRFVSSFEIYGLSGYCGADYVLRYEHLQEDLAWLSDRLGLPSVIDISPHNDKAGVRPAGSYDYLRMYDAETIELVGLVAAREAQLMGYRAEAGSGRDAPIGVSTAAALRKRFVRQLKKGRSDRQAKQGTAKKDASKSVSVPAATEL